MNRKKFSLEERQQWVDALERSGMGIREFCEQSGIAYHNLSRWRRLLGSPRRQQYNRKTEPCFVEVAAPATERLDSPPPVMRMELPGEVTITIFNSARV
jgi:transposase-like protein